MKKREKSKTENMSKSNMQNTLEGIENPITEKDRAGEWPKQKPNKWIEMIKSK